MATDAPFDAENHVWKYRFAHETGDKTACERLRKEWTAFDGEDSLHECAFGEPIGDREFAERKLRLIEQLRSIEAQLNWLKTVESVPDGLHGSDAAASRANARGDLPAVPLAVPAE